MNSTSKSTYDSRGLILVRLVEVGPLGSCGVAFGILPIIVASEEVVAAKEIAFGVYVLVTR